MVTMLTISRTGGSYTDSVFGVQSNPSVVLMVTKWKWLFKDVELAIDLAETTDTDAPETIAGGFKKVTVGVSMEGYLDSIPASDTPQTKLQKLWNIIEFGNPSKTYAVYRGRNLFGISYPTEGQLKVTAGELEENARVAEPAIDISGSTSNPYRVKVNLQLRKMKRST